MDAMEAVCMAAGTGAACPPGSSIDLGALAWLQGELRRSLQAAVRSLRHAAKDQEALAGSDVDVLDPAVLRGARQHLHQGAGALEMVGLPAAARLLHASEALVQRWIAHPAQLAPAGVALVERASFGLLDYVARLLAGIGVSPLALFPHYRAVQEAGGAERVHPADLWIVDWRWLDLPGDAAVEAAPPDAAARQVLEEQLLALMKSSPGSAPFQQASRRMGALCAQLGAHAQVQGDQPRGATLWKLAAAVFEAQALGLLQPDVYGKRVASRLLQQFRASDRGDAAVDERLAQDLLFFCARSAVADAGAAPRLAAVRRVYGLGEATTLDYGSIVLGRIDPALVAQARRRVAAAKESWAAVAAGEAQRHDLLIEQFSLVGDSLHRLYAGGDALAEALQSVAAGPGGAAEGPRDELAMEVATSLLYLEASLEDPELDPGTDAERSRVLRLAERIATARSGPADPPEPWMESLYRRVSDRQTIACVVQELRASLAESEAPIDRYFRHPDDAAVLQPVQAQLQAVRGVLSVLGLDAAAGAVQCMRADLDHLVQAQGSDDAARRAEVFDRLAGNLGALGFLIDLFGAQPQMAKSLFAFDAARGVLEPLAGRAVHGARPQPATRGARGEADASAAAAAVQAAPAASPVPRAPPAPAGDDMRAVFLEEAADVLEGAREALVALAGAPGDRTQLAALRRAFHTLKGSSRMVGLTVFGDAAARAEEACNRRLADREPVDPLLQRCCERSVDAFADWIDALLEDRPAPAAAAAVSAALDELGAGRAGAALPAGERAGDGERPRGGVLPPALPPGFPPDVPSAADLDLSWPGAGASAPFAETLDLTFPEIEPAPPRAAGSTLSAAPAASAAPLDFDLDLSFDGDPGGWPDDLVTEPAPHWVFPEPPRPPPPAPAAPAPSPVLPAADGGSEDGGADTVRVGTLRIARPLFEIYVGEAGGAARRLEAELMAWAEDAGRPVGEEAVALAHSLAGCSATVGYAELSQLARGLEELLAGLRDAGQASLDDVRLVVRAGRQVRQMLGRFADGHLDAPPPGMAAGIAARLDAMPQRQDARPGSGAAAAPPTGEPGRGAAAGQGGAGSAGGNGDGGVAAEPGAAASQRALPAAGGDATPLPFGTPEFLPLSPRSIESVPRSYSAHADAPDEEIDAVDAVDSELFPVFEEEARDLLPQLAASLREWAGRPADALPAAAAMRALHTLKGSARLAGALRLGDMCHRLEARIERLLARAPLDAREIEVLQARSDALALAFDALRRSGGGQAARSSYAAARAAAVDDAAGQAAAATEPATEDAAAPSAAPAAGDSSWMHFPPLAVAAAPASPEGSGPAASGAAPSTVRVRTPLLDRLVSHAGEVSIARTRIETDMQRIKGSLADLNDNFARLRQQLRDLELLAELEVGSHVEAAKAEASSEFDPLELDRYTSFQELSKMMAESVNDVLTVQRALQRAVEGAEDTLAAQGRLTRDMQDDLMRTRMVEFESLAERLYRVVRQAAKESGRQVRLDIYGGSIEIDRGLLDRMTPAFEHLLRNCVVHGIEPPQARAAAGKEPTGSVVVALEHVGNEVAIEFRDDGAGLDLARIRERGVANGLIEADAEAADAELAALIFRPGFTTVDEATELAGRGVGMDVVYSEVNAVGGRIETATAAGQGTSFRLLMPLTTAVTQVVLLRAGALTVAVPSTLLEVVRRVDAPTLERAYAEGAIEHGGAVLPFHWLGALLEGSGAGERHGADAARPRSIVVVRSARQRVALHVDEVLGRHEAVVKNLGPQLARVPGLVGITLLATGEVALIYNPVALASRHGAAARARTLAALSAPPEPAAEGAADAPQGPPLVLVVDDSITVRRVTQRLLEREGYRVAVAKDGVDALEQLAAERPSVVLSDIEMPRMDGFDLVRRLRAEARYADLPVIVITSRSARKHRELATELGVDHYLGKPYAEEELLELVARHAAATRA